MVILWDNFLYDFMYDMSDICLFYVKCQMLVPLWAGVMGGFPANCT